MKTPLVLILDEATSVLASQTEREIKFSLDTLSVGRSALVITQRLGTTRNADLIVVMQTGRIAQTCSRAEPSTRRGLYSLAA